MRAIKQRSTHSYIHSHINPPSQSIDLNSHLPKVPITLQKSSNTIPRLHSLTHLLELRILRKSLTPLLRQSLIMRNLINNQIRITDPVAQRKRAISTFTLRGRRRSRWSGTRSSAQMPIQAFEEVGTGVGAVCRVCFFAVRGEEGRYEGVAPVCAAVAEQVDPVFLFVGSPVVGI